MRRALSILLSRPGDVAVALLTCIAGLAVLVGFFIGGVDAIPQYQGVAVLP